MTTHTEKLPCPDISFKAITKLATPLLIANLSIMGAATIDTVMAGHLGKDHLAVVAFGTAVWVMVLFAMVGTLQSLSPITGHHYGAKKYERIGFELTQGIWLAIVLGAIGFALLMQYDLWLAFGDIQPELIDNAKSFLLGAAIAMPAAALSRVFISVNGAVSRPRVTMYISILQLLLKVPLNLVFMYGALGFPAMGGAGAAWAIAVNCWIGLILFVLVWKFDAFYTQMRAARFYAPQWAALKEQLRVGLPIGLSVFFEVSSFTLMAIFITRIGIVDVAAHQVVANVTATLFQIPFSLAIGVCILVSQCLGAGYPQAAREVTIRVLKIGVSIAATVAVFLYFFRAQIVSLYVPNEPEVQALAASLLIFGVIYHAMDACQSISAFAMRGYRVTFAPMIVFGSLLWGVGIGGGYYFGFHGEIFGGPFGAAGFWGSTCVGLILAGIALFSMAMYVSKVRLNEPR